MVVETGEDAAGGGVVLQVVQHPVHLVHLPFGILVLDGELIAIGLADGAVRIRPLIPDRHFVVVKILDICVAVQEPEQFMNDRARMQLLRGDERKAFREREPHLVAENRDRSGACAVSLLHSVFINVL